MEEGEERLLVVTANKGNLFLGLNDYKVSMENLDRELSEQEVILKAIMPSVKQFENKLSA